MSSRRFQLNLSPGKINLEFPGLNISREEDRVIPSDSNPIHLETVGTAAPPQTTATTLASAAPTKIQSKKIDFLQCLVVATTLGIIGIQVYPPAWKVAEGTLRNPKTPLYALLYAPTKSPTPSKKTSAQPKPLSFDNSPVRVGETIAGYPVTSKYGPRAQPCPTCSTFHRGIDIGTQVGTPLYAVIDTNVECFFQSGITGKFIKYSLGSLMPNYDLQILHVDSCIPGPKLKGQKIGTSGAAGTGAHTHLEIKSRIDGSKPPKNLRSLAELSLKPEGTGGEINPLALAWPTAGIYTQEFSSLHPGIDIANTPKTTIYAARAGRVIWAGALNNGLGNAVKLLHDDGSTTTYGHASKLLAKYGDRVTQGQSIALIGSTGKSNGTHLHFEYAINGSNVNPLDYLP